MAQVDPRDLNELRSVEELASYRREVCGRLDQIDAEFDGLPLSDEVREEYAELEETRKEVDRRVKELNQRAERARQRAAEGSVERGDSGDGDPFQVQRSGVTRGDDIWNIRSLRASAGRPEEAAREIHDRAMRAIELARPAHPDIDRDKARARLERLLERDSEDARFGRYLLATGNPVYKRAFPKLLAAQMRGTPPMLSGEEHGVVEQVGAAERALNLTGAQGGFAVPFELDPTILLTSSGAVNPIRQISNVKNITVDEWRGVTSAGVTAAYAAEAAETADNAPTLVQPTISTERAQAFIPYSIEIGQDWNGLADEMAELIADAKDVLEAAKFISGTGTNEPFGVLTGTTNTVNASTGQTFTLANLYALLEALPPRYRQRGAFISDLAIANRVRQFDTAGGSAVWEPAGIQGDVPGRLLGKPWYEASEMPDTPATGNKFLLFGDFSRYVIADRIGLNVEAVPHLFGANRRPTGERGLFAYWRNGAKVVDANALRALIGVV